jgi:hypothetical protein
MPAQGRTCTSPSRRPTPANYTNASKDVTINVLKGTPVITWANPADITYPTLLSGTQLNATADVGGAFVYTPASGTQLNAGPGQTLHVAFTPTDTANYTNASKDVTINVLKGTPVITWANPADITYPTLLERHAAQCHGGCRLAPSSTRRPAARSSMPAQGRTCTSPSRRPTPRITPTRRRT